MKPLLTIALFFFTNLSFSQTITVLTSQPKISLRGLSVVNDNVLWASGSNGTVARSVDGGKTFQWLTVKGYEQRDFRDVEAFDSNAAIIMAVAEPAIILKTKDGGKNWKKVFEDTTKGMFLDAMEFVNQFGCVVGDPIKGKMFRAETSDSGETWKQVDEPLILLSTGEAMFASSGTNIKMKAAGTYFGFHYDFIVTGGTNSRLIEIAQPPLSKFKASFTYNIPFIKLEGKESQGANSIDILDTTLVIVGGDFADDKDTTGNCVLTNDFGKTWLHPQTSPHGYRSCVEFINQNKLITCGTSGVDMSNDGGNNWMLISPESFHVCQKARKGDAVFLAGKDGRIARLGE